MNAERMNMSRQSSRGMSGLNILLGLWVVISPFVLTFAQNSVAMWNNVATGGAIALLALMRLGSPQAGASWMNIALGVWLIISPFVLGFTGMGVAMWNNVILGIIVALVAMGSSTVPNRVMEPPRV
jgi:hypothetical protein